MKVGQPRGSACEAQRVKLVASHPPPLRLDEPPRACIRGHQSSPCIARTNVITSPASRTDLDRSEGRARRQASSPPDVPHTSPRVVTGHTRAHLAPSRRARVRSHTEENARTSRRDVALLVMSPRFLRRVDLPRRSSRPSLRPSAACGAVALAAVAAMGPARERHVGTPRSPNPWTPARLLFAPPSGTSAATRVLRLWYRRRHDVEWVHVAVTEATGIGRSPLHLARPHIEWTARFSCTYLTSPSATTPGSTAFTTSRAPSPRKAPGARFPLGAPSDGSRTGTTTAATSLEVRNVSGTCRVHAPWHLEVRGIDRLRGAGLTSFTNASGVPCAAFGSPWNAGQNERGA